MTGLKITKQDRTYFEDASGNIEFPSVIFAYSFKTGDYFLSERNIFPVVKNINSSTSSYSLLFLGVIGLDYLMHNNSIIDFGNRKLYVIRYTMAICL